MIEFTLEVDNCQKVLYHIWWLRQFGIPYKVNRAPNTQYIVSLSYGKDSIATIEACKQLGLPLDGCVHAEVWATDTIPADLPPMVDFKAKADKIIKQRYGLNVYHICAMEKNKPSQIVNVERERQLNHGKESESECHPQKRTYESIFYHKLPKGKFVGTIKGFPKQQGSWCKHLKEDAFGAIEKLTYEKLFYKIPKRRESSQFVQAESKVGKILGFPQVNGVWCNSNLKRSALNQWISRRNEMVCRSAQKENSQSKGSQYQSIKVSGVSNSKIPFSTSPTAQRARR